MLAQLIKVWMTSQRQDLHPNVNYSVYHAFCQTDNDHILHNSSYAVTEVGWVSRSTAGFNQ